MHSLMDVHIQRHIHKLSGRLGKKSMESGHCWQFLLALLKVEQGFVKVKEHNDQHSRPMRQTP